MRVLVVGGGSGGHIMPAVAVVKEMLELDEKVEVEFWTDKKNYKTVVELFEMVELETSLKESTVRREHEERVGRKKITVVKRSRRREIVEGREVRVRQVCAGKFRRYGGWKREDYLKYAWVIVRDMGLKNFVNIFLFLFGVGQSLVRLVPKEGRPDVVFLKGGFVGLPVGIVAGWLKIPYLVHESDATPGLANRILRKKAKRFLLGVSKDEYRENERVVGVPIGDEFKAVSEAGKIRLKKELGFLTEEGARPVLVVVGGSQGSEHINTAVVRVLPELLGVVQVGLVTGRGHYKTVIAGAKEVLGGGKELPEGLRIWDYSTEIEKLFGAADVVVSRAGASTIAELAVMKKAVILVPFEALPGGHQAKNARRLKGQGAAVVVSDEEMVDQPVKLLKAVREVVEKSNAREEMEKKIGKEGREKVARVIGEEVLEAGK